MDNLKGKNQKKIAKNLEELIKYKFEEWYSIPQSLVKNVCNNYIKRIQKILPNNGTRLVKEHLEEIRIGKKFEKKYLEYLEKGV